MDEKTIEMRLRRRAKAKGYRVEKSRARVLHMNNRGGYQLIDIYKNAVVDGPDYDLDLTQLERSIEAAPRNV